MKDKDIRRMCVVHNSDDSGVGMTVPDVAYPVGKPKVQTGVEADHIDSAEDKMRKLEAIYNDDNVKVADQISAMALHHELQQHVDRVKAGEGDNGIS